MSFFFGGEGGRWAKWSFYIDIDPGGLINLDNLHYKTMESHFFQILLQKYVGKLVIHVLIPNEV